MSRAFSALASSTSAAKRFVPAASPTPAQIAPMSLSVFQTRSSSSRIVRARASSGVGERPRASSHACAYATAFVTQQPAQARATTGRASASGKPLGRPFEPAVLVEQARVDVEDQVADDVEAEVARLDHAGVDRSDRDLVRVGPAHGRRESVDRAVVVDERPQRLVPVEARRRRGRAPRARPSRRRERGRRSSARRRSSRRRLRGGARRLGDESTVRTTGRSLRLGGVQAREAPAVGQCRRRCARGTRRRSEAARSSEAPDETVERWRSPAARARPP